MGISRRGNNIRLTGKDALKSGDGYATSMAGPRTLANVDINKVRIKEDRGYQAAISDLNLIKPIRDDRMSIKHESDELKNHLADSQAFASSLTPEELDAVKKYTNNWYRNVASIVYNLPRPWGVTRSYQDGRPSETTYKLGSQDPEEYGEEMKDLLKHLWSALKKAPVRETPQLIYRGFLIHDDDGRPLKGAGDWGQITDEQIDEFVEKHFPVGGEFYRKMPTSATIDPRVAIENFLEGKDHYGSRKSSGNRGFIIEYVTKYGAPISHAAGTAGMKDSYEELEVIVPPKKKYRVVGVHKKQDYWLHVVGSRYGAGTSFMGRTKKQKYNFTIIQVVDAE